MSGERVQVTRGTFTTAPPEEPGTMIPNFELDHLEGRAQKMTNPLSGARGWALALLGGALGTGGSSLTLYAYEQEISSTIEVAMWLITASLFVLSGILGLINSAMRKQQKTAVDEYCEELKLTRRRYGEVPPITPEGAEIKSE